MDRHRFAVAVVPAGARHSVWFVLAGLTVILIYFLAIPKVDRDAAQAGSAILVQLPRACMAAGRRRTGRCAR